MRRGRVLLAVAVRLAIGSILSAPGSLPTIQNSYAQPPATPPEPVPTTTAELADAWDQAYRVKNWPEAIRIGKLLSERTPGNSGFRYNLACVYAQTGKLESSMASLKEAVRLGFDNVALLDSDGDLDPLRADQNFMSLVETVSANRDRSQAQFQSLADAQIPLIWTPAGHDPEVPAPIIIALHPYGSRAEWILDYWKSTAELRGAIVLAPRAVRAERDGFQWGTIAETQYIVEQSFNLLKKQYAIDDAKILLTGFSQGGYMAFNLGRLHGNVVTSVLPIAGQYDRELADPFEVPEEQRARFYVLIGTGDSSYRSNLIAIEDLRSAGFDAQIREIEGLGHTFPPNHERELADALDYLWK